MSPLDKETGRGLAGQPADDCATTQEVSLARRRLLRAEEENHRLLLDLSALASEVARLTAKLSEKEKQLYQSRTTCKETEKAYRESIAYMLGKALTDGFTSLSGFTRLPHRLFTVGKAAAVQWWLRRKAK